MFAWKNWPSLNVRSRRFARSNVSSLCSMSHPRVYGSWWSACARNGVSMALSPIHFPPALQAAIAEQQDQSEKLISWIQLAIIVTFATLYVLSRRSAPNLSIVTPAFIATYFVLTVIRVFMTSRIRLTFWLIVGSILFDMGLLFGLVWSFHIQYQQPPAFYLKAPTLLYVFIFIALRALRFEVLYIVLAGLAAAASWLFMIGYVRWLDPRDEIVTHDFARYMTSNTILLGAEFDKIISILMVTAILALAVYRARQMLLRAIVETKAKENLARFFDPSVARRIGRGADAITAASGETREVSILMIDIRDFTRIAAQIPADDVIAILTEYRRRMLPVIEEYGGSVDKFLGDGIMATFGAVDVQPDSASRACRALEESIKLADAQLSGTLGSSRPPLKVCGAVSCGRVVCGVVGDESRLEYTVIGNAVNLVAKLEKQNKALDTRGLITATAYQAAKKSGYSPTRDLRMVHGITVEGVDSPVDVIALS